MTQTKLPPKNPGRFILPQAAFAEAKRTGIIFHGAAGFSRKGGKRRSD